MSEEQFNKLLSKIEGNHKSEGAKMADNAWKVISTIGMALTVWIFSTVQSMDTRTAVMQKGQSTNNEIIGSLDEKIDNISDNRFTSEDYETKILPLVNQVNQNTTLLNERTERFQKVENDQQSMSLRLTVLEREQ